MAANRCIQLFLLLPLSIVILQHHITVAKIVEGSLSTGSKLVNWGFLTRFCFLSRTGRLEFEFWYPTEYDEGPNAAQNIILYHDNQWPQVYGDRGNGITPKEEEEIESQTCADKESILLPENNQVINLTTRYRWSGCAIVNRGDVPWYKCQGGRTFASSRERWWYIVVANCASTKGLHLDYKITMTNDLFDNNFFKHFSADEFYILQLTIVFICLYMLLLVLSIYVAFSGSMLHTYDLEVHHGLTSRMHSSFTNSLHLRQLYHTTYKLYMSSMSLQFLAVLAQTIYWADYAITGVDKINWKNLGRFLEFAANALFLILLVLMGKGYTITRARISTGGVIKLIVFSIFFIAMTVTMFIWEITSFDPGLVLYIYDSIPGYVLLAIKIASWLWFCYAIFFTLKHYPEKMSFYIPFFILYTLWFWLGTTVALVAIDRIPRWMKEKVVQGCILFITFIGHLIFLILTWPTMANKTFPYHIKTTQVGAMEVEAPTSSASSNNNNRNGESGAGAYGPSDVSGSYQPLGERQFIDMFTTDRTRSNDNVGKVDPDHFPHQKPQYEERR